jgi:TATA-binding protein-associated factor Taf7
LILPPLLDPNALFCVCRTKYDNDRFYLGCENCNDWFHGRCVGVTEGQAEAIDAFICPPCEKKTGKITTYLDPKQDRASRRKKKDDEAEELSEAASSSSASSASSEESEPEESVRPLLLSRIKKKGGKIQWKVIPPRETSDEEGSGSGSEEDGSEDSDEESGSGASSDAESEAESEEEEEEEEEEDTKIHLKRFSTMTLRLKKLPDADMPESKTRKTFNAKRYECQSAIAAFVRLLFDRSIAHTFC